MGMLNIIIINGHTYQCSFQHRISFDKKEEMTEILEELHRYVPEDGNKLLKVLILLLGVRVVQ